MKHLKLFKNTNQYESYKNGSDYVLPNVSYVEETKGVKYERKKPKTAYTLRATYNATPDNLVAFTGATNIKSLTVNGRPIKFEPLKNEIFTFDVLGENISMNMETGEATFPESYLIKSPVSSWSFKAKDPNYVINENTYFCMLSMTDGMMRAHPIPFEEAMNFGFTTNDGVTLEAVDTFLDEINMAMQYGQLSGFALVDIDLDNETFKFVDAEHQTNVTTGGISTYSFDSEGLYDIKIDLTDSIIKMSFAETPLTSIEIGNNITTIRSPAFSGCSSLTSVTIPNSVTTIGEGAFEYCDNLTSVNIPDSVTTIEVATFYGCSSLTSVTIPNSVTTIRNDAFAHCSRLSSINIPDSVTTIGRFAFLECNSLPVINNIRYADTCLVEAVDESLTNYSIKEGTRFIGSHAFSGCSSLTSINIPNSVIRIGEQAFWNCSSITSINIPNSVTTIEPEAFVRCYALTSVTIGDGVTTIGEYAFYQCSRLTNVYCKPKTPPTASAVYGDDWCAFNDNASSRKIYVPTASVDAYKTANGWSEYASDIEGTTFKN